MEETNAGASEASEETKHWRGKRLFVNNGLPLQCFVRSEPSDASAPIRILSALRMRGLHDKRHLLAKLRIAGSKNSHGLSSNFNSVAKIDDSSSSMQIIVNTEQC